MNAKPKTGEWWMCEVWINEIPYSKVLYYNGNVKANPWQPEVNKIFTHRDYVKLVEYKYQMIRAI